MKYYAISDDVLKAILAYLMQRPYSEVAEGIQVLNQLPEINLDLGSQEDGVDSTSTKS